MLTTMNRSKFDNKIPLEEGERKIVLLDDECMKINGTLYIGPSEIIVSLRVTSATSRLVIIDTNLDSYGDYRNVTREKLYDMRNNGCTETQPIVFDTQKYSELEQKQIKQRRSRKTQRSDVRTRNSNHGSKKINKSITPNLEKDHIEHLVVTTIADNVMMNFDKVTVMPLVELDHILFKMLDPWNDYRILIQVNKYYQNLVGNNKLYQEFREFRGKNFCIQHECTHGSGEFLAACRYGYINVAEYFYERIKYTINREFLETSIICACICGHPIVMEWLYNLSKMYEDTKANSIVQNQDIHAFRIACMRIYGATIKWALVEFKNELHEKHINKIDIYALLYGYLEKRCIDPNLSKWVYDLSKMNKNITIDFDADCHCALRCACSIGHREMAEWLYNLSKIDIHINQEIFRLSCQFGHIDVAKWLYDLSGTTTNGKININAENDSAFRLSCENDYWDVTKWLYHLSKADNNTKINANVIIKIFCYFCSKGKKDRAAWLYDLSKGDDDTKINALDEAFTCACKGGHVSCAKWLYNLSKTDGGIKIDTYDNSFWEAFCSGHLGVLKWLYNLSKIDKHVKIKIHLDYSDEQIKRAHPQSHKNVLKWYKDMSISNSAKKRYFGNMENES